MNVRQENENRLFLIKTKAVCIILTLLAMLMALGNTMVKTYAADELQASTAPVECTECYR